MAKIAALVGIFSICLASAAVADGVPEPYTSHFERAMQFLRTSLRNPASMSLVEVRAVKWTKTICITYRAQDDFGGYNVEHMAYIPTVNGVLTQQDSAFREQWHRYCELYKTTDITPQALAEFPSHQ